MPANAATESRSTQRGQWYGNNSVYARDDSAGRRTLSDRLRAMSVVLHVSEAWGGGIVTATEWIAAQAPEHEHHVLYLPRGEIGRAPDDKIFARAFEHNGGRRSFVRHARRMLACPTYDIVHSHSSWAGVICRTFARPDARQFYSPHCFASERRDISQASRWLFELVERVGASRTDTLVANGTHEAELAAAADEIAFPITGQVDQATDSPADRGKRPRVVCVIPQQIADTDQRRLPYDVIRCSQFSYGVIMTGVRKSYDATDRRCQ